MIRALFFLAASAGIWIVEGFLFSHFLRFSTWQTAIMAVFYIVVLAIAIGYLKGALDEVGGRPQDLPVWHYLTVVPMVVVVVGSFLSLAIVTLVASLGALV